MIVIAFHLLKILDHAFVILEFLSMYVFQYTPTYDMKSVSP